MASDADSPEVNTTHPQAPGGGNPTGGNSLPDNIDLDTPEGRAALARTPEGRHILSEARLDAESAARVRDADANAGARTAEGKAATTVANAQADAARNGSGGRGKGIMRAARSVFTWALVGAAADVVMSENTLGGTPIPGTSITVPGANRPSVLLGEPDRNPEGSPTPIQGENPGALDDAGSLARDRLAASAELTQRQAEYARLDPGRLPEFGQNDVTVIAGGIRGTLDLPEYSDISPEAKQCMLGAFSAAAQIANAEHPVATQRSEFLDAFGRYASGEDDQYGWAKCVKDHPELESVAGQVEQDFLTRGSGMQATISRAPGWK
ncbi:MAG: hypothetical protein AAF569_00110 [Pseudomonadota bacterium]